MTKGQVVPIQWILSRFLDSKLIDIFKPEKITSLEKTNYLMRLNFVVRSCTVFFIQTGVDFKKIIKKSALLTLKFD